MNKVLEPVKVGPFELKKRAIYIAASMHICNKDFSISDEYVSYYETLAKHGVPLMITGATICDAEYPAKLARQPGVYSDDFIPGLKRVTEAVHRYGAKIFLQLWHPGQAPYGTTKDLVKTPADWTIEEIRRLQQIFCDAAVRAQKAGFDGVEWHLAHNYLPEQFLVSLFNKRTDEYGAQTAENGMRFSLETIQMIQTACGRDFPIAAKINATDEVPGGIDETRLIEACKMLESAGIIMISVSGGGSETDITGMSGDGAREEGWKLKYAELVKKNVSIPVVGTGSLRHPDFIDAALREGKCDLVGTARALYADPEWLEKIAQGREDEIRYCISCLMCLDYVKKGCSGCTVNPRARRQTECPEKLPENGNGRTVAVIGAGPGGMQAAITLAQRGFRPVIYEKYDRLGGHAFLASLPVNKYKLGWFLNYQANMIKKLNIEVHLQTKVTADMIRDMDPYAVVVAAGSRPVLPRSIGGLNLPHVYTRDVLLNMPQVKNKNILVAGVGQVGLEIGETFAEMGNSVTIIDFLAKPAIDGFNTLCTYRHTKKSGVSFKLGRKLIEVTPEVVRTEIVDSGESEEFAADLVIVCLGAASENELYQELASERDRVFAVGDAKEAGKIRQAVQDGYDVARLLDA